MEPISKTAFYCTGVRALDARQANPICGDQYAERFMDAAAWQAFEPFKKFTPPNISNATRHRIIDDLLRDRLARHPKLRVVIIGAGFDSRAFRLKGGQWLEVDEPQIFAWKNPRLPAVECPNPLTRVPIDFESERLTDKLAPSADSAPVVIVVDGVLFYLPEPRTRELLRTIRSRFPNGEILCDIMTVEFINKYGRALFDKIRDLGAALVVPERPIADVFREEHYRETQLISMMVRAREMKQIPFLMSMLVRFNPLLHTGYTVRVFEPSEPARPGPDSRG